MKISTKITTTSLALVICSAVGFLLTVVIQREILSARMESLVQAQAHDEAGKIIQTLYFNCVSFEQRNQSRLTHDLQIAREVLGRAGPVSLDTNSVEWNAVNQFTKEQSAVQLPKWLAGGAWLGKITATNQAAPVVDEVRHLTCDHCTIFQRMNEAGDMLRVDTSVITTTGVRAVGTFIPHQDPGGSPNQVVSTVLKGETYRGRAFVVNEFHDTAYEPIWDASRQRVIGMLYVGVGMNDINRDFHDGVVKIVVGKTGHVFVLDSKGTYVVSPPGQHDGESAWDARDTAGHSFIQSIIEKALKIPDGGLINEAYAWKSPEDPAPRNKFIVATHFKPWDWVIGAETFEDDYGDINRQVVSAMDGLVRWALLTAGGIGLAGLLISHFLSISMTRPLGAIIARLNAGAAQTAAAAAEVSDAAELLAQGSGEQAASIEETGAALEEMASVTRSNAGNAVQANDLARGARAAADKGAVDMRAMSQAMEAIKASSDDIANIIRTIDEIAFQTNILALNAAVEAARAGQAGLGFAVVADEVRNLAQRSAQAAKETAAKIEGAISRTAQGVEITQKVAATLNDIVAKARQVDELASQVAGASRQQTQGISQINIAVGQMDKVTQSNAASAEESASAAQELNSQARMMNQAVHELTGLVGNDQKAPGSSPGSVKLSSSTKSILTATPAMSAPKKSLNGNGKHPRGAEPELTGRHGEIPLEGDFKDF